MKTLLSALSLTILAVHLSAVPSASLKQGPRPMDAVANGIGRWVPDVAFVTVEGKKGRLSDFKGKKALVVAFTGASCPLSKRFAPTLAAIEKAYGPKGVAFVFVDPIAVKGAKEDLREMAGEQGFEGPVILDEDESLTRALGARTTTDTFVLDSARTVLYRGPIDDQYGIGYQLDQPRRQYLKEALDAHLTGKPIQSTALWAPGCELDASPAKDPKQQVWTYHKSISRILEANCVECHRVKAESDLLDWSTMTRPRKMPA